jgi:hypothetical protein
VNSWLTEVPRLEPLESVPAGVLEVAYYQAGLPGGEPVRTRSARNHPLWVMTRPRCRIMIGRTPSPMEPETPRSSRAFRDEADHDPVPLHLEVRRS